MNKAVFAGTFDPFTVGHLDIVRRAAPLFDEFIVLLARNDKKKPAFTEALRADWILKACAGIPNVKVDFSAELTVDFMQRVNATYLVRGIRSAADLAWEQAVAYNNKKLYHAAETLILLSAPEHFSVSSSLVRELLSYGRSPKGLVPEEILDSVILAWRALCSE